jgi:3-phenylpropionate/trans-cinnamate dioxygenase ferredoxin reductase component
VSRRVVVVGASLGGLRAAEALRSNGFTDELVVVGDEPHLPYNRPPLSKEALKDGADAAALQFRRRKSVDDVTWRLGVPATSADFEGRVLALADGTTLGFDALVAASGLRSRRLAIAAPDAGRHAVRTVEDAQRLRVELVRGARVVVIGAGFIGCEVAATARGLGCSVDVVAPEAVPMQRPLGLEVGAALQRRHEGHGVVFHFGRLPTQVEGGAEVASVVLDDDTVLAADVVVEALGCIPNTEWLAGTGLDLSDGVLTDGWLRAVTTSGQVRDDVVAVGDLARFPNALYDDVPRRVEHWSVPTDTGKRAGATVAALLAGAAPDPTPFTPMPSFWSDQYDQRLQSFGALGIADAVSVLEGDLDREFVAGYLRAGRLVGVAGVGLMQSLLRWRGELLAAAAPTP